KRLRPLTLNRAKPLVPFCGVFRLIDFTLSNCVNSNLKTLYPLIQHKHISLQQYIEVVAENPNGPFRRGHSKLESLLPKPGRTYIGTADAVLQNLSVVEPGQHDFVLILAADHLYNMDYTPLLRHHADSGAELTVAALEYPRRMAARFGVLEASRGNMV